MPTEITMPKLSDTMTEGILVEWRKNVGQQVERGEILAEVETDKATMELESFTAGVLLETRVKPGDSVAVGTIIAVIGEKGEKPVNKNLLLLRQRNPQEQQEQPKPTAAPPSAAKEAPGDETAAETPKEEQLRTETGLGDLGEGVTAAVKPQGEKTIPSAPEPSRKPPEAAAGEKASPLVRRLAREQGVDLAQVKGSGPEGRILQEDLDRFSQGTEQKAEAGKEPSAGEGGTGAAARGPAAGEPMTRMRSAIARTVAEAWRTIPHFTVTVAIDMGEGERVRQELREAGAPFSLNDLVVKAAAVAIGKFPLVNAAFHDEAIVTHDDINIGIAVALDHGLLIPVIKGCQFLSLKEIASRSHELTGKARAGNISEADISGGTFSVSNLGKFGVEQFTAVIHPTQGAILAVGAVSDQPVIRGGHLAAARIMRVTLSADHRLLDGAYAAQFLQELKRVLENPVQMLV